MAIKTTSRLRNSNSHAHGGHDGAGGMRWLLTYADMITLLLALFIILFAISNISKVKLQRLAHEISGGFNAVDAFNLPVAANDEEKKAEEERKKQAQDAAKLAQIKKSLESYIRQHKLQGKIEVGIDRRGLVITLLSDAAYYDSGSAQMRPQTKEVLDAISHQLRTVSNHVRVEGRTDNVPISTALYPTNWELSAARATNVTRYLIEKDHISPDRLYFSGYGQYQSRYPNDTLEHRQQNRRVDIIILKETDEGRL
jgi:chemotaxis protein MotB